MAMLEARPYRPFKSSEEYLEAMKEDLAEWLSTLYPELEIKAENFMDRLDTGVALCKHANYVRQAAEDYLARRQARNKSMTRSMTSGLAGPILALGNVYYLPAAKSGTFFARDNVSNFITWCRKSLKIIECLLFETDDLIMRKNEKHVILCLLEVARRGAKFGMLAPMLVQMERQIDREIAADNKANGVGCGTQTNNGCSESGTQTEAPPIGDECVANETDLYDSDTENEDENDKDPMLMYGPQPQIITNDLKSLDEMVRDLVEKCTCPSQFPMVRVSEGKYRIGDTKVLIFVRILRSHVMVRVGGGWDTLSHYLDKHDPCRCRAQHRSSLQARLMIRNTSNSGNGIELHKAHVIYERSPPAARRVLSNGATGSGSGSGAVSPAAGAGGTSPNASLASNGGSAVAVKHRSRSPTPQRKFLNQTNGLAQTGLEPLPAGSPYMARRSMSPSQRRINDMRKKQSSLDGYSSGPKSLPAGSGAGGADGQEESTSSSSSSSSSAATAATVAAIAQPEQSNKFENISDNGSEISDEGYRSLGVIQSNAQKRESLHSQASIEDAETNARLDQTSSDSQSSPTDEHEQEHEREQEQEQEPVPEVELKTNCVQEAEPVPDYSICELDGPQSLPAVLPWRKTACASKFEQSGVFITDDEITVTTDPAEAVPVPVPVGVALAEPETQAEAGGNKAPPAAGLSKIPRSPLASRRRRSSIDNSTCGSSNGGSLQDLHSINRKQPVYRSVRRPPATPRPKASQLPLVRDVTNTWSGRSAPQNGIAASKKRPTINPDTFAPPTGAAAATSTSPSPSPFERGSKTRHSQILYDSNGRRVRGGCSSSLTTSPVKNHAASPLAQQLLEAASSSKNDAQILEKMKSLLYRYAAGNQQKQQPQQQQRSGNGKKTPVYEDFTSAWVHSNGNLERSESCSPPAKARSKRSSAASSCGSNNSAGAAAAAAVISPRRERGLSKIPAPVRQHTELY
ncbi:PREDICTED: uncharacterized protein LOC108619679 isoform X1 [Drosophila arizonae]|uniref:Uncharacterized protein LOC108619679 isoform X1 n=1 Tax=Drosophila arizonae TaxID=7263 RepID=A0ABM1PXF5_DROAR|nr:PREDICTED: uncharacterized protein LOC108619679 isoform X1 [Drosophila arizonae]